MNAPKILPWLARKWGLTDARALELWRQACDDADDALLEDGPPPHYWTFVKDRMFDLLHNEAISRCPVETPWVVIRLNIVRFLAEIRLRGWTGTLRFS